MNESIVEHIIDSDLYSKHDVYSNVLEQKSNQLSDTYELLQLRRKRGLSLSRTLYLPDDWSVNRCNSHSSSLNSDLSPLDKHSIDFRLPLIGLGSNYKALLNELSKRRKPDIQFQYSRKQGWATPKLVNKENNGHHMKRILLSAQPVGFTSQSLSDSRAADKLKMHRAREIMRRKIKSPPPPIPPPNSAHIRRLPHQPIHDHHPDDVICSSRDDLSNEKIVDSSHTVVAPDHIESRDGSRDGSRDDHVISDLNYNEGMLRKLTQLHLDYQLTRDGNGSLTSSPPSDRMNSRRTYAIKCKNKHKLTIDINKILS